MRKSSSLISKILIAVFALSLVFTSVETALAQVTTVSATKTTVVKHKKYHKKSKKRKKVTVITHASEDDKKLQEVKDAKDKQKAGK